MNNNLKKLEFDKILDEISSYCKTYIGREFVTKLRPSQIPEEVQHMLDETSQGVVLMQRKKKKNIQNIVTTLCKIKCKECVTQRKEM